MNHNGKEFLPATQMPLFCEDLEGGAHQEAMRLGGAGCKSCPRQRLTPNDIDGTAPASEK